MVTLPDMASHLDALEAALADAGWHTHVGAVLDDEPPLPYVLLSAPPGSPLALALCDAPVDLVEDVRVTVVSDTPRNCLRDVARVRSVLHGRVLAVLGRRVAPLRLTDSQPVQPDREVVRSDTRRNPYYTVDVWNVTSTPEEDA